MGLRPRSAPLCGRRHVRRIHRFLHRYHGPPRSSPSPGEAEQGTGCACSRTDRRVGCKSERTRDLASRDAPPRQEQLAARYEPARYAGAPVLRTPDRQAARGMQEPRGDDRADSRRPVSSRGSRARPFFRVCTQTLNKRLSRDRCVAHQGLVHDDGIGLPPKLVIGETRSLGLQIVTALAKQLEADLALEAERRDGATVRITFRREDRKP